MFISEIKKEIPHAFKTGLQKKVYETLSKMEIPFERVDTDVVITMEDCEEINKKLDMKMVKTLFLTNRQQTAFYLFITAGDKPFRSKDFSEKMGISRLSFAPAEKMAEILGTEIGAATVFSFLLPPAEYVTLVFDKEVLSEEYYGCSDGTTTGYLKIKTADITDVFLKNLGIHITEVSV